jgi:acylphosphatase
MVRDPEHSETRPSRAYRVVGRVQGVGFRQWTHRTAERLGLSGTVRNLPDGSVEVMARGTPGALAELEAALKRGPMAARVERVEALAETTDAPGDGFRIVH